MIPSTIPIIRGEICRCEKKGRSAIAVAAKAKRATKPIPLKVLFLFSSVNI